MTVIVAYRKLKRLEILDLKIVLIAFLGFFCINVNVFVPTNKIVEDCSIPDE